MTLPTISSGVGWQTDFPDVADWAEVEDGMDAAKSAVSGTVFQIDVAAAVGNKKVYYENTTHISKSSTFYTQVVFRYKTSSALIKARIAVEYSDATVEYVTGEISSITWKYVKATITTEGKTIDHIRLYATSSTGTVSYDFVSLYHASFELPECFTVDVNDKPKLAVIPIPGSDTNVIQHMGRDNSIITIDGPMRAGKTWGGSVLPYGEYFKTIVAEPFVQWLETDGGNYKVMPHPDGFHLIYAEAQGYQVRFSCKFIEYDAGDTSIFTDPAWYGINQ